VQDAVIRNLQTLAESSQRLSDDIKATESQIPWRELAGFRNVIVHGYLGIDLGAIWLVVEQDLPALSAAVARMAVWAGTPDWNERFADARGGSCIATCLWTR
jgi:uncharacterized protein with HEPN domain